MDARTAICLIGTVSLVGGCGAEQMRQWNALFNLPENEEIVAAQETTNISEPSESQIRAFLESARQGDSSLAQETQSIANRSGFGGGSALDLDLGVGSNSGEKKRIPNSGSNAQLEFDSTNTASQTPRAKDDPSSRTFASQNIPTFEQVSEKPESRTSFYELTSFGVAYTKSSSELFGFNDIMSSNSTRPFPPMHSEASSSTLGVYVTSVTPLFRTNEIAVESDRSNFQSSERTATVSGMNSPPLDNQPEKKTVNFAGSFFKRIFGTSPSKSSNSRTKTASASTFRRTKVGETKALRDAYRLSLEPLPPPGRFQQLECLVNALYFEARGEGKNGQLAVAEVIMNRVNSRKFPNSICSVVTQGNGEKHKCQFSYNCDGLPESIYEREAYEKAWRIAAQFVVGYRKPLTNGATHFHSVDVQPNWASKFEKTASIGRHLFFKESL
ncbi:MAG: cell wall hydrolase [Albidovulum sp.]|nr:cell wall hydrolase [Albidovulum sp.]MDE0304091.1 cell wall hydrolase [Albidovulum sp.]MDE0533358.1 cell wall hydrolase [Albidovulum sp.]